MKKILITTTALLLAVVFKVNAQTTGFSNNSDKQRAHIGIKAGANLSNVIQDVNENTTNGAKAGFVGGLFVELPIVTGFSIQPEVLFSQKGYKSEGNFLGTAYEYKLTSNFIDVPLLAKFKPSENFGIVIGPQFSFLTSTKTNFTVKNAGFEATNDEDNDNLRKNILGGVVGIEAGAGPVVFDLRYNLDFQSNNGEGSTYSPKYKNQVLSLTAGIRF